MTHGAEDYYAGPERREEPDMRVLAERMDGIKGTLTEIKERLARLEESQSTSCRSCSVWARVGEAEKRIAEIDRQVERSKGMAVGISSVIGLAWAVVSFVISHK